jgi:hypothetical protein
MDSKREQQIDMIRQAAESYGFWMDLSDETLELLVKEAATYLQGKRKQEIAQQIAELQAESAKIAENAKIEEVTNDG